MVYCFSGLEKFPWFCIFPSKKKLTEPLCGRLGCQKTSSCCKCLKLCWAIVLSFRDVRRRVRVRRRDYDHHHVHR